MNIKRIIATTIMTLSLVMVPAFILTTDSFAATCTSPKDCIDQGSTIDTGTGTKGIGPLIKEVVKVLLFVLGAIAVIMIVVGGIRYAVSGGDSGAVTSAKNTILYAVIGLVVALLAYAIVNFVLTAFT